MLKRINGKQNTPLAAADLPHVRIADAAFPAPFRSGLEYSSPARGTWNIVHTGMLVPECHIIYACAAGCLRGVVLTAAEMGAMDRFSQIVIRERDLLEGDMEDLLIEGTADIIGKLPKRPPAVMLHTSCVHHFTATDLDLVYRELRSRFPDIDFADGYMNPIMRKSGLTPDQLMRTSIYKFLREREADERAVAIIGGDMPTRPDSDIMMLLEEAGLEVREITSCGTYDEYQKIAGAKAFISIYPDAGPGADTLAERLGRPHYRLAFSFDYDEIDSTFAGLAELLGIRPDDSEAVEDPENRKDGQGAGRTAEPGMRILGAGWIAAQRERCEKELAETKALIGDTPVAIDYTYCPRPLGLARLLLDHGFNVTKVYLDGISSGDSEAFRYLQENYPELTLSPTVHAGMRFANTANSAGRESGRAGQTGPEGADKAESAGGGARPDCDVLAIGQKAAYFEDTDNFVNIVEGGGMNGYEAVTRTCELMRDAYMNKKDMRSLVQVKGLGCGICVR